MINLIKDFKLKDNIILKNFTNLTTEEKEMIRTWRNSDNIRKWMYADHLISAEEHDKFIAKLKENSDKFCWLVKDKDGECVGVIAIDKVNFKNKSVYFGIYVNPYLKRLGFGRFLGEAAIKFVFDIVGLHTLKLEVIESNIIALKLYMRLGFKEEGRLKEFIYKDGKWKDAIIMGITNKENEVRCGV